MYLCQLCKKRSDPGRPAIRHYVYREVGGIKILGGLKVESPLRKEIEKELLICGSCQAALREGVSLEQLAEANRPQEPDDPTEPLPPIGSVAYKKARK